MTSAKKEHKGQASLCLVLCVIFVECCAMVRVAWMLGNGRASCVYGVVRYVVVCLLCVWHVCCDLVWCVMWAVSPVIG